MDLSAESDAGLLLLIGGATDSVDDKTLAVAASREFHRRHYSYVLSVLESFSENVGAVAIDAEVFAAVVFEKAFRRAHAFNDTSDGDREIGRRKARAWLGVIANNLAKDELKRIFRNQCGVQVVPLDEQWDIAVEPPETEYADNSVHTNGRALKALQTLLDTLRPEERDILTTYGNYGISTATGTELPIDVRDALETRTGYERCNIRQKWHRLTQRLKSQLEQLLNA